MTSFLPHPHNHRYCRPPLCSVFQIGRGGGRKRRARLSSGSNSSSSSDSTASLCSASTDVETDGDVSDWCPRQDRKRARGEAAEEEEPNREVSYRMLGRRKLVLLQVARVWMDETGAGVFMYCKSHEDKARCTM